MPGFTLLLGADRGEREATFAKAINAIRARVGTPVALGRYHWTEPWGFADDQLFLNQAVQVETALEPARLLDELLAIEASLGRARPGDGGYAPRPIDIDILFAGGRIINLPRLVVPHPKVHLRAFALGPAADIVPALVHPKLGRTVLELLDGPQLRP